MICLKEDFKIDWLFVDTFNKLKFKIFTDTTNEPVS